MGKATVLSSLGAGLYSIRVEFDNAWVEARLSTIDQKITELADQLTVLAPKQAAAQAEFNDGIAAVNSYISNTSAEQMATNPQTINDLTVSAYQAKADYDLLAAEQKRLKLQKTSLEKDREYFIKYCPNTLDTNAWCVVYNEDLTGTLKTIEVDYIGGGYWLPPTAEAPDSQLQHPMATSVHANWVNLCLAPAMQKEKGRYRVATLTYVDWHEKTCNLVFNGVYDVNASSADIIEPSPILPIINGSQIQSYSGADIDYNSMPFSNFLVGDLVVVDLHSGAGVPTVIGFHDHPRRNRGSHYVSSVSVNHQTVVIYDGYFYFNFITGRYELPPPALPDFPNDTGIAVWHWWGYQN